MERITTLLVPSRHCIHGRYEEECLECKEASKKLNLEIRLEYAGCQRFGFQGTARGEQIITMESRGELAADIKEMYIVGNHHFQD